MPVVVGCLVVFCTYIINCYCITFSHIILYRQYRDNKYDFEILEEITVLEDPDLKKTFCIHVYLCLYAVLERKLSDRFPPKSQQT